MLRSSACSWPCSAAATCSSRTCPALARPCSPSRSRAASAATSAASSARPTSCRATSPASPCSTRLPAPSSTGRAHRGADRTGRRDQPGDAQDPVRPARGHGGAAGHGGRQDRRAAGALPRARHPEPDRVRGHLPPAGGPTRPLPHPPPARLSRHGRRDRPPGQPAPRPSPRRARASGERRGDPGRAGGRAGGLHRRPRQAIHRGHRPRHAGASGHLPWREPPRQPGPDAHEPRPARRWTAGTTWCRTT